MANGAVPLSNDTADDSKAPTGHGRRPGWDSDTSSTPADVRRLRVFADWMDRKYVDPILGLILPGAGDALASIMGVYAVVVAYRLHMHPVIIARMLVNLGLDALIGAIPFVGWLLDFFFKAHIKNLELLQSRASGGEATIRDWFVVAGAAVFFLMALVAPLLLLMYAFAYIAEAL